MLLNNGHTIANTLAIVCPSNTSILTAISQGKAIEDCFTLRNNTSFYHHYHFFLEFTSFCDAIIFANEMYNYELELRTSLLTKISYPVFLLFFSLIALSGFTFLLFPQLINSLSIESTSIFYIIYIIIKLCLLFIYLLFIVSIIIITYFKFNKSKLYYLFKNNSIRIKLVNEYYSYITCGYLIIMQSRGISTKQIFYFLSNIKKLDFLRWIHIDITNSLSKGISLADSLNNQSLLTDQFKKLCLIGIQASSFNDILKEYLVLQMNLWTKKIKHISIVIQVTAYSFVGIMVILMYQVMLLPLNMIEQL
ncbi:MAG: hypothetical protein RR435_00720 [Erysipelotrichaceae bacterium]